MLRIVDRIIFKLLSLTKNNIQITLNDTIPSENILNLFITENY